MANADAWHLRAEGYPLFNICYLLIRCRYLLCASLITSVAMSAAIAQEGSSIVVVEDGLSLVAAARSQVGITLTYDSRYQSIDYPAGDIPLSQGVCTDVVIRAFRSIDIDLQVSVHQDMEAHFDRYPRNWGLKSTDTNIDHRRVPNLATYFKRQGKAVPISQAGAEYLPGDIVVWRLSSGLPHIGIVSDRIGSSGNPEVIHNIGLGTREEDNLFDYDITGHYRWF